jgi:hypothetical protein
VKTKIKALERDVIRLVGPARVKPRGSPKKLAILLLMWITPGLPPPGPFG